MSLTLKAPSAAPARCSWAGARRCTVNVTAVAPQPARCVLKQRLSSSSSPAKRSTWRLAAEATETNGGSAMVATEGDIVTLNWRCYSEDGELLESSEQSEEPTTFEVGAGDIVGNRLFEAFDEAVRGLAVGDVTRIKAEGGEWKQELLFRVPREHPEVQRLEGRYKNQGGVREGLLVELSNGGIALVVKEDAEAVVLDANNMLAGKSLWFEIELAELDRPQ